jgi:hypothetical protein
VSDDLELSRRLTTIVAQTPGVTDVYVAGSILQAVRLDLVNATSDEASADAKVAVARDTAGIPTVTVTIGVDASHPVPATVRAVSEAVAAHLLAAEPLAVSPVIDVKVSRIS